MRLFSPVPNWVPILAVLLAVASIFFYGRHVGVTATELKYKNQQTKELTEALKREQQTRVELEGERSRLRDVSGKLQTALSSKDVVYVDVVHTITKEVEKPVYSQCFLPASGVSILGESAARLNATRSAKD